MTRRFERELRRLRSSFPAPGFAPPVDAPPVDTPITHEKLARASLADEKRADKTIANDALADDAIMDDALADDAITDDALADEKLADEKLVEQIAAAVRQALRLKTAAPRLLEVGRHEPTAEERLAGDWPMPSEGLDGVVRELCECLEGLPLETHPRNQVNVNAQPSTAAIIGALLPTLFNPNLASDGRGAGCSRAEQRVTALAAELAGFDPRAAGGLFTFGGTGTVLYGVKLGLETAIPGAMRTGIDRPVVVLASERAHHTCLTAAGWLGIGEERVWRVPAEDDFSASAQAFEAYASRAIEAGYRIAAIVATVGTTDAFGVDDVASLVAARDRLVANHCLDYSPHVHADAVIGWAWNVFRDYDFSSNGLEFDGETRDALQRVANRVAGLCHADSLGVDFHKTGFVPYVSSLFLVRRGDNLEKLARQRDSMPYLFHSGQHHPGRYSLETTRSASGVLAAFASLRLFGRDGLRVLLGSAIARTRRLRHGLAVKPWIQLMNASTDGPVTLFRAYPPGWNAAEVWRRELEDPAFEAQSLEVNAFNRRIHEATQAAAREGGLAGVGWTEAVRRGAAGQPLAALKSYLLSPFLDEHAVDELILHVARIRESFSILSCTESADAS